MSSNIQQNRKEIEAYRKQLRSMVKDISDIDAKVLTIAVNKGLASAKRGTPVDTGFMRKMWGVLPTIKKKRKGAEKTLYNAADYASFVNYGHRTVTHAGITTGWVKGIFMLDKAERQVRRSLKQEFQKEIERVNKKHDR